MVQYQIVGWWSGGDSNREPLSDAFVNVGICQEVRGQGARSENFRGQARGGGRSL